MIQPMCFPFDVITKLFYTILTSIDSQWILYLPISELALNAVSRGDVLINAHCVVSRRDHTFSGRFFGTLLFGVNWF